MPAFSAPDGTVLAYRRCGEGVPVVCLPGGPMQDSAYLGDLGGLSAHRALLMLDPRGTGGSAVPADPASYRCDRQVADVEALREHLGVDRLDLLAHSAGANLAALYVERHPDRVRRLALVAPSTYAVGIHASGDDRLATVRPRRDEPWFAPAFAALEALVAGEATGDTRTAIDPFFYGRWDEPARAHVAAQVGRRNDEAAAVFGSDGVFDPAATRAALGAFPGRVLLLGGEFDLNTVPRAVTEYAGLFQNAEVVLQPGASHFPWLDDAARFVRTTAAFLDGE